MIDTYVLCCISMITALGTHNCFLFENVCLFAYYVCVCVWVHTDNGLNTAATGQLVRLGMGLKELTQVITLGNKCFTKSYCQSHSNFFKISFTCVSSTFSKWQVSCSQLLHVTMTARKNKKQWRIKNNGELLRASQMCGILSKEDFYLVTLTLSQNNSHCKNLIQNIN